MSEANHRDSDRFAVAKKEGSEGNLGSLHDMSPKYISCSNVIQSI